MKLLIVDDDPSFNNMLRNYLTAKGFEVASEHSAESALKTLQKNSFDLVLTDLKLPGQSGLELIDTLKKNKPELPVILITNYADIRMAVNSIKLGAYEFVSKPVIPDELLKIINKALESVSNNEVKKEAPSPTPAKGTNYIIGNNKRAKQLWNHIELVAPTKMNILITGQSGSGKEYVARKIHNLSKRSDKKFVAVDCGVLSKDLAASELFGHLKGAFTGANNDKEGLFEAANNGTLFLDEIGNLPYEVQVKLLRALQERTIKRVGGNQEIKIDVRIVAATNENLGSAIDDKTFRNDLYHRLNEFEIYVPSLRERIEDIQEFCQLFVKEACDDLGKPSLEISQGVLEAFKQYHWPGNVRELKNIIKRAALLANDSEITPDLLPVGFASSAVEPDNGTPKMDNDVGHDLDLKQHSQQQEKDMIVSALQKFKYNKSAAAQALNIDRSTLYKKIKDYNIDS